MCIWKSSDAGGREDLYFETFVYFATLRRGGILEYSPAN